MLSARQQFGLLLWKNWQIQSRSKMATVLQMGVPTVLTFVLFIIRQRVPFYDYPKPITWNAFSIETLPIVPKTVQLSLTSGGGKWLVPYAPNNTAVTRVMMRLQDTMNISIYGPSLGNGLDMISLGFATEEEMMEHVSLETIATLDVLGAVIFTSTFTSNDSLPKDIKYKIRLRVDYEWPTKSLYSAELYYGPRENHSIHGGSPGYFSHGFLTLQKHLDHAIIYNLNSSAPLQDVVIEMKRHPYPPFKGDPLVHVLSIQFPLFILLSLNVAAVMIIKDIVLEKERKLKESMKMMGLSNWLHWTAWFVKWLMFLTISGSGITVMLKINIGYGAVLTYSDGTVIFVFLLLYIIASICYCFMVAVFFPKANSAAAVGFILFFASYIPYFFLLQSYESLMFGEKLTASFLSNTAMGLGCRMIAKLEAAGVGMKWTNINKPTTVDDDLSMAHVFIMFFVDSIVYLLVVWWMDAVFPGDYGVPQPWYFFVTRSYWCGDDNKVSPDLLEEDVEEEALLNTDIFEPYPPGLKAGIKIRKLRKVFKRQGQTLTAVNKISLDMFENQITALLGHNGAGKSTTMFMLTGFLPPTSGTCYIAGMDIRFHLKQVRSSMGLCPQHDVLFDSLTVREHLYFFARLKGVAKADVHAEIEHMIKMLHLEDKRDERAQKLSGGMKRKLSVGIALMAGSKIVILDEPTSGMDPEARRQMWDILQAERHGRTMLLSTHFMDEADVLADRIAIMAAGNIQCYGSSLFLKKKYGVGYHLVLVKCDKDCDVDTISRLVLEHVPAAKLESNVSSEVSFSLPSEGISAFEGLFKILEENRYQLGIDSFGASVTTLEEVFLKVGQSIDQNQVRSIVSDDSPVGPNRNQPPSTCFSVPTTLSQTLGDDYPTDSKSNLPNSQQPSAEEDDSKPIQEVNVQNASHNDEKAPCSSTNIQPNAMDMVDIVDSKHPSPNDIEPNAMNTDHNVHSKPSSSNNIEPNAMNTDHDVESKPSRSNTIEPNAVNSDHIVDSKPSSSNDIEPIGDHSLDSKPSSPNDTNAQTWSDRDPNLQNSVQIDMEPSITISVDSKPPIGVEYSFVTQAFSPIHSQQPISEQANLNSISSRQREVNLPYASPSDENPLCSKTDIKPESKNTDHIFDSKHPSLNDTKDQTLNDSEPSLRNSIQIDIEPPSTISVDSLKPAIEADHSFSTQACSQTHEEAVDVLHSLPPVAGATKTTSETKQQQQQQQQVVYVEDTKKSSLDNSKKPSLGENKVQSLDVAENPIILDVNRPSLLGYYHNQVLPGDVYIPGSESAPNTTQQRKTRSHPKVKFGSVTPCASAPNTLQAEYDQFLEFRAETESPISGIDTTQNVWNASPAPSALWVQGGICAPLSMCELRPPPLDGATLMARASRHTNHWTIPIATLRPVQFSTGGRLLLKHYHGLIKKRILYTLRSPTVAFAQMVVPVIMAIITGLQLLQREWIKVEAPPIVLNTTPFFPGDLFRTALIDNIFEIKKEGKKYNGPVITFSNDSDMSADLAATFVESLAGHDMPEYVTGLPEYVTKPGLEAMEEYLVDVAIDNLERYRNKYLLSATFENMETLNRSLALQGGSENENATMVYRESGMHTQTYGVRDTGTANGINKSTGNGVNETVFNNTNNNETTDNSINNNNRTYYGWRSNNETNNETKVLITAWFNNEPYRMPGVSLAVLSNALLDFYMPNEEYDIEVTNHPLPLQQSASFVSELNSFIGDSFQVAYYLTFGMAFLVSSFVLFLVQERVVRAKQTQYLSGVHQVTYWVATFIWDIVTYCVPLIGLVIILFAFDMAAYVEGSNLGVTVLIFVMYALSVLPVTYICSLIFQNPATAYIIVVGLNIFAGSAAVLSVQMLAYPSTGLLEVSKVLEWIFHVILPHFNFIYALKGLYINSGSQKLCRRLDGLEISGIRFTLDMYCKALEQRQQSNPCCPSCTGEFCVKLGDNYLSWKAPGVGMYLVFMGLESVVLFTLLMFFESGTANRWRQAIVLGTTHHAKQAESSNVSLIGGQEDIPFLAVNKNVKKATSRIASIVIEDDQVTAERLRLQDVGLEKLKRTCSLVIHDLEKWYGDFHAVQGISLAVPAGECFGLLGVNGAGKTTTFKMLTGEESVSGGNAFIEGYSIRTEIKQARVHVGYCPQFDALTDHMTIRETMWMVCQLRGVPNKDTDETITRLSTALLMENHMDKRCHTLSGGNKRKLSTAIALIGEPSVVFLDEPTTGMDPVARRHLWNVLNQVRASGKTLVLTSHSMEECEALCTRIAVMVNGQFKCLGSAQQLKNKFGEGYTLMAKIRHGTEDQADGNLETRMEAFMAFMETTFPNSEVKDLHQDLINYQIKQHGKNKKRVSWSELFGLMEMVREEYHLEDYSVGQTTLEQVFINFARTQRPPDIDNTTWQVKAKHCCSTFLCCSSECCRCNEEEED